MKIVFLFFLLYFASQVWLIQGDGPKMAKASAFRNMVSIRERSIMRFLELQTCTGALVTLQTFLTSKHCIAPFIDDMEKIVAYVGDDFFWQTRLPLMMFAGDAQTSKIVEIEDVTGLDDEDISMVTVETAFVVNPSVKALAINYDSETVDGECKMPSWGAYKLGPIGFESPWLRAYTLTKENGGYRFGGSELPSLDDRGAPIIHSGRLIAIYLGHRNGKAITFAFTSQAIITGNNA